MNEIQFSVNGWQLVIVLWTLLILGFAFGVKWLIYPKATTRETAKRLLKKRFAKGPISRKS